MKEPDVVRQVHRFLARQGVAGERLSRLYTDPHPTLTGIRALQPFQRFAIGEGDLFVHPDLLGLQADSESLVAVEAKGANDLLKGLTQAELYQKGVQLSFLAAPASSIPESLLLHARDKGVGVLAVDVDAVRPLHVPESRRPLNRIYNALRADLGAAAWISDGGTFVYNLPTHYLVWAAALYRRGRVPLGDELRAAVAGYPLPGDAVAALRGARKLGLVVIDGDTALLSDTGHAVASLLPSDLAEWAAIHRDIAARGQRMLADRCPTAAAVLRVLLLRDPVVQIVMEGLRALGPEGGSFVQLAQACWRLDRRKAVIFFLKPEAVDAWVARDGSVDWHSVDASAFRSTTFFQYKSVLRHAGLIAAHALGGASTSRYDPAKDRWQLVDAWSRAPGAEGGAP